MKRIKILYTLNNAHISGIENFVLLVLKYINKELYDITVAIPFRGNICKQFDILDVKYHVFNKEFKAYTPLGIFNIFRLMYKNKYDIIHANAGIIPCILGKILGSRLIIEHKHGLDFSFEKRNNIKGLTLIKEEVKKYFVDITFTGCESDRQYLINVFRYQSAKVCTLHNGVEELNESYNKVTKNVFTIGTIGRLTYQKGHNFFIQMAKLINDEIIDNNFIFEIWGEGDDRENLINLINDLNLTDKVYLMGYADKREEVYTRFDIFVLTSRYEGIPFVILEAMRAKLPIVSTDVGGINEVIKDNYNGLLVKKDDPTSLKDSVLSLFNDNVLLNRLKENAFCDYKNYWGFEKTISKLTEVYENYDS